MSKMLHRLPIGLILLGALMVVASVILGWTVVPIVIDQMTAKDVQISEDSDSFRKWMNGPLPIYRSFYVFHVTNPDEVEAGEKPKLKEMGPYIYREIRTKVNISHNDEDYPDHTIQYQERKTYFFDQARSGNRTEDDRVNVINFALVYITDKIMERFGHVTMFLLGIQYLNDEPVILRNVSVGDVLFHGLNVSKYSPSVVIMSTLPEFAGGKFALFKNENGTDSRVYSIYTGVGSADELGFISTIDELTELGYWETYSACNQVKGSDGSLHPPFIRKDRVIDVLDMDFCRTVTFTFSEETKHEGISAYRFTMPNTVLEDPRKSVENECYCLTNSIRDCPRAGVVSLQNCRDGAPIMMSLPYFLDGNKKYNNRSGLPHPDRQKHESYFDIEPYSGTLLKSHKRSQVNIHLIPTDMVKPYQNLTRNILFPLVWTDESMEMDKVSAEELKVKLQRPHKIWRIVKWTLFGFGWCLVGIGTALYYTVKHLEKKQVAALEALGAVVTK